MILVSEENSLHIRHHAFSRLFHAKIFVPCCQRRYFSQAFYWNHYYPDGMIACGLCLISQPKKNYSACCSCHSVYVCFNRFISRIENKFKPPRSDRGFLFEGFFPKILTLSPISVITQRFILPAIDLFVLITRTFSPSARSFPHFISLEELLN